MKENKKQKNNVNVENNKTKSDNTEFSNDFTNLGYEEEDFVPFNYLNDVENESTHNNKNNSEQKELERKKKNK